MKARQINSISDSVWRLVIILAVIFQASLLPLDFLFHLRKFNWYQSIDGAITLIFIIDLIRNIIRYQRIKKYKLNQDIYWDTYSTWQVFITDLLAVLPYALLFSNPVWQLLRFFKWVKVWKTIRNYHIRNLRRKTSTSLWYLVTAVFLFSHWFACLWLPIRGLDTNISNGDNYIKALYYTITTLTSVGYGDVVPNGNVEMFFNMILQLIGVALLAFLVGNVVSLFTRKDPAEQRFIENMEKLRSLIHYQEIPKDLEHRISDYFTYEWKQKLGYDKNDLLDSLPYGLRGELQIIFLKNAVRNIPILKNAGDGFARDMAMCLQSVILTPGDYLFKAGDEAEAIYFVQSGNLEVLSKTEGRQLTILKEGDFLGELALIKDTNRTASVRSLGFSDVFELKKEQFEMLMEKYPEIAKRMKEKSVSREKRYI